MNNSVHNKYDSYDRYKICFYEQLLEYYILEHFLRALGLSWVIWEMLYLNDINLLLVIITTLFWRQIAACAVPGYGEGFRMAKNIWFFIFTFIILQPLPKSTDIIFILIAPYGYYCLIHWTEMLCEFYDVDNERNFHLVFSLQSCCMVCFLEL
jgi:hypothetical protein